MMRAVLYAVKVKGEARWVANYSIAWDVDANWWLGERDARGESMIKLADTLPLGMAESACEQVNIGLKASGELGSQEVKTLLCRIAKRAWEEEWGENERTPSFDAVQVRMAPESGMTQRPRIAELAREVCARVAGRALLEAEAQQLLAEVGPEWADPGVRLAALQQAMLDGGLRLAAAVGASASAGRPRLRPRRPRARRREAALTCRRCGSGTEHLRRTPCAACGGHACAYCEACLTMGRSRACGLLVIGAASRPEAAAPISAPAAGADPLGRWSLSPAQREAAAAALRYLQGAEPEGPAGTVRNAKRQFLLWAVTGAGKTEMIFPLLESVLSRGGRALVATPRRDVVLELAPRLAVAFPDCTRSVLYGGSVDRWANSALTLATTHQLIRFEAAFDLVLVDEMDAFPYRDDRTLQFAAAKCCRPGGVTLYLSATPPPDMQRAVARRRLACARVPVRYHGHPLPVPQRLALPPLVLWLRQNKLPPRLFAALLQSMQRGAQAFVFVPMIRQVDPLVRLLRQAAERLGLEDARRIDGTSSKDALRADKVSWFRQRDIRLLVTTTILERGVTIPKSDVYVLDADAPLFDAAALVQMAGRAGRAAADPCGAVVFGARSMTGPQRGAIRQIRSMNKLAKRQGYLRANRPEEAVRT